jgi:phytoene dehydrogenase-like protein
VPDSRFDAVVVGAGPNGLSAAIELQRQGLAVLLVEANDHVGGAARTEEVTLPGFRHDVGSAVHPLGAGSPFFESLPLDAFGLHWIHPEAPLAHPLGPDRTVFLESSLASTVDALGSDGPAYRSLTGPFALRWPVFARNVLDSPLRLPDSPGLMLRFAPIALRPTTALARRFTSAEARALLAGNAAHAGTPLEHRLTGAIGTTLMVAAHAVGWPFPRGGAGRLTEALARYFSSIGGTLETGRPVTDLGALPETRATLLALTFRQVGRLAGSRLPGAYRRACDAWRYGPGAYKIDWALDGPIPWTDARVARAGTVHVGGTLEEIAASERAPWSGQVSDRPFVLLAQPSLFDPTRAPEGRHTAWGYCHVPNGWDGDATEAIEARIERFAPGFRARILSRAVWSPRRLEAWDANLVGGDVNGGAATLRQVIGPRRWPLHGWRAGRDLYVCSASTPPGGGVHGMAGFHAARAALRRTFGIRPTSR